MAFAEVVVQATSNISLVERFAGACGGLTLGYLIGNTSLTGNGSGAHASGEPNIFFPIFILVAFVAAGAAFGIPFYTPNLS